MEIINIIQDYGIKARDPNFDGFTSFEYKKKLYQIKWACEEELAKSPTFVGEEDYLQLKLL